MNQTTFIVYDETSKSAANAIGTNIPIDKMFYSPGSELTENLLLEMADCCLTEYFYLIRSDFEIIFPRGSFTYKPPEWDKEYIHIWNNDSTVRLFNVDAIKSNPSRYTTAFLESGKARIKNLQGGIYNFPEFDIIFLSFDESNADEHYDNLLSRFPRAKRVHGIKGIYNAHRHAAEIATTSMFYVVDADAEILPEFDFSYNPHSLDMESVHVWHSRNPVNNLEYGYGGVKLFPRQMLLDYCGNPVDFTTSVSKSLKVMEQVSNMTRFNTDPFSAWRSGFRECAKLASKIIHKQDNTETEHRLKVWCNIGEDSEFGDFTIMGAREGAEYGAAHKDQPELLGLINDFRWLEKRFSA